MQPWEFYETQIEVGDALHDALIAFDPAMFDHVPDPTRTWLLEVHLPHRAPRPDEVISDEDHDEIIDVVAALKTIARAEGGVLVGHAHYEHRTRAYFYFPTKKTAERALDRMRAAIDRPLDGLVDRDEGWGQYQDFLWPSDFQWTWIWNRRWLMSLDERGDPGVVPRRCTFDVAFPTPDARATFVAGVAARGFRIESEEHDPEENEVPYIVSISLEMAPNDVFDVAAPVVEAAAELEGAYVGVKCTDLHIAEPQP